ncbi:MAG: hypothetical protein MRY78_10605 [Saprospiraceae bacterium]|nr:hypothetical protein [Saprospiraceae bacterium]
MYNNNHNAAKLLRDFIQDQDRELTRIANPIKQLLNQKEREAEQAKSDWLKAKLLNEVEIIEFFCGQISDLIQYKDEYTLQVIDQAEKADLFYQMAEEYTLQYGEKASLGMQKIMAKSTAVSLFQKTYQRLEEAKQKIAQLEGQINGIKKVA